MIILGFACPVDKNNKKQKKKKKKKKKKIDKYLDFV